MKNLLISFQLISVFLLLGCGQGDSGDSNPVATAEQALQNHVWRLYSEQKGNKLTLYPIEKIQDKDNDGSDELFSRDYYYLFRDGWVYQATELHVIQDDGFDQDYMASIEGKLYALGGSYYEINESKLTSYEQDWNYSLETDGFTLTLGDTQQRFVLDKNYTTQAIIEAPSQ
ncbi:hypothetical protein [Agarivorans sp. QJM3NY_33]|uniref:hypothetical protein n=1 Tax=Agarivorans sp. QJM3NY_33 TaxID=3421432 RepID=UPI003D7DA0E8